MSSLEISVYDSEDLNVGYTLRQRLPEYATVARPRLDQTGPVNLTGKTFLAQVKTARKVVVLTLDVDVVSAVDGELVIRATKAQIAPLKGKALTWSLHIIQDGIYDRLWGASFEVLGD